jgi:fucose permease
MSEPTIASPPDLVPVADARAHTFSLTPSYAAMMALATAVNLMPICLVAVAKDFHNLTSEEQGRIGAVTFAGLCVAILASGPLVDRLPGYGAKAFAVGGNLLIAAGLALLAYAPNYHVVLATSFIMGLGAGSLDMILSPIVSVLRPDRRTVALNFLHGFYCVGAVLTILAGALALKLNVHWRAATLGLIPFPLLVAVGFVFAYIPPLIAEGSERLSTRTLLKDRFFQLALLAITLGGATELGLAYWLPTYAQRELQFTKFTADLSFLGFSLAMAIGRLAIGLLGHKISTIHLLLYCCLASTILFLIAGLAPATIALAACITAGLAGSTLWPSTLALVSDRHPHGGATMFALLAALGNAGGIAMPWLMGTIADRSTLALAVALGAAVPFLMFVILLAMKMSHARKSSNL